MNKSRLCRKVVAVECCFDRHCTVCAGLNRTVIFAEVAGEEPLRERIPKKKANYERGSRLSEEKRNILLRFLSESPQYKTDIAILSNLCARTVENAANGNKMFNATKRALENGIELMVAYVRDSQEIHCDSESNDSNSTNRPRKRREKGPYNTQKRSQASQSYST